MTPVAVWQVYRRESTQEEMIAELEVMWAGKQKFQLLIKPMPKLPLPLGLGKVIANFLSLSVGVQVRDGYTVASVPLPAALVPTWHANLEA